MILTDIIPQRIEKNTYHFTVWAPFSGEVTLQSAADQREILMSQDQHGYWNAEVSQVNPGFRYKYSINKNDALPDPASRSQPDGVHGASELVDLGGYAWSDEDWKGLPLSEMIIYELHVGTFSATHDFAGVVSKLDYLKDLGINTIELMPVAQFSGGRNWGYDGAYPFAVQSSYGGPHGLMELVDAAHGKGLAVILDVVYNHLGPEGNYLSNYGSYFSDHYSTPWGSPINFDGQYADQVRNYFIQNALMWCRDFHIDGLRLDAVHAIYDFSATHFLKALKDELNNLGAQNERNYILIAESNLNDVKYIDHPDRGGFGLDAQWSDDFHHAFHSLVTGEKNGYYMDYGDLEHFEKALKQAFVYDGNYSPFRKKSYGSKTENFDADNFVIFHQNHDQTGNRKNGERLIEITDFETAKVAAATMLISPNVPMLFMGEEYAERNPFLYFVSHEDDELNRLVKEGRQLEFKDFQTDNTPAPDPSDEKTFESSMLSWDIESSKEKETMHRFYKRMIALRKNHPALNHSDKNRMHVSNSGGVLLLERWSDDARILIIVNPGLVAASVALPLDLKSGFEKLLNSSDPEWLGNDCIAPDHVTAGDQISSPEKTIIIYSDKVI